MIYNDQCKNQNTILKVCDRRAHEKKKDKILPSADITSHKCKLIHAKDRKCITQRDIQHIHRLHNTVKRPLKNRQNKKVLKAIWLLNAGHEYCWMLPWSILQYFWPALSHYWYWKPFWGFDKTKVLKPYGSLMPVKSTAAWGEFCNTFDLH